MKAGRDYVGIGVGAMVFDDQGRVFLAQRGPKASNERGTWEFPGGKVSFGERLTEAVRREFLEEYGMLIETTELLGVNDHILLEEHEHWVSPTFLARHTSGEPRILEAEKCTAIGWFNLHELPDPLSLVTQDDLKMYREKQAGASLPPTVPDKEPFQVIHTEEQLQAVTIGELTPLAGAIQLVDYSPTWPLLFAREAERIHATPGIQIVLLEHVGSTSVPGLAAKPRIDMLLVVPDSADEAAYVPALEAAGYKLSIRETDWYEHRLFRGPATEINLHVFSQGCPEAERMLLFRDWLRTHPADRLLYEATKRELARQDWKYMQNYADAKTSVVNSILARALNT
ncbi:MAG TPA: GrpB family protein [Ktedonobacteraceae bacterium]